MPHCPYRRRRPSTKVRGEFILISLKQMAFVSSVRYIPQTYTTFISGFVLAQNTPSSVFSSDSHGVHSFWMINLETSSLNRHSISVAQNPLFFVHLSIQNKSNVFKFCSPKLSVILMYVLSKLSSLGWQVHMFSPYTFWMTVIAMRVTALSKIVTSPLTC